MATPVLFVMLVFPSLIMVNFGGGYIVSSPLLQVMVVGQFVNVATGSVGYLLTMTNHEKDFRNVVFISGVVSLPLAFILTKEYGALGASYATAFSISIQSLLAAYMVKIRLGFNSLNIFRRV